METWGARPCHELCGPSPGLNGFAFLDLCFLLCKMSYLTLTSTLPLVPLFYSRLGKELRFRHRGWWCDLFSHPFPPGFLELQRKNPTVFVKSCLQTQDREGREVGRLLAIGKRGAPRTQLILRGKGCRSTAPSQEEAEVPASVVASTTTSHPEASRQLGHLTTLPVPHMLSDPALGPCGIVRLEARTYSPSPTPQQGARDQRSRKAMQSADIGE